VGSYSIRVRSKALLLVIILTSEGSIELRSTIELAFPYRVSVKNGVILTGEAMWRLPSYDLNLSSYLPVPINF
jgi:hypothetical protein